jgi:hypothetical protein
MIAAVTVSRGSTLANGRRRRESNLSIAEGGLTTVRCRAAAVVTLGNEPVTCLRGRHRMGMAEVTCERCAEVLGDFVEGRLAADERASVEAHLGSCGECSNLHRDYVEIPEIVRRATHADIPAEVELRLRKLLARWRRRPT